jgi:hypothetical protein
MVMYIEVLNRHEKAAFFQPDGNTSEIMQIFSTITL